MHFPYARHCTICCECSSKYYMLKIKNINENSKKRSLESFTECTEWRADRGNWEIIRKKCRRKANNSSYKKYPAISNAASRSGKKNINLSLVVVRQCGGTLLEEVLLQWWGNYQAAVIWVKAVRKWRKPWCWKLLRCFEEKKAMIEAREPTDWGGLMGQLGNLMFIH